MYLSGVCMYLGDVEFLLFLCLFFVLKKAFLGFLLLFFCSLRSEWVKRVERTTNKEQTLPSNHSFNQPRGERAGERTRKRMSTRRSNKYLCTHTYMQ